MKVSQVGGRLLPSAVRPAARRQLVRCRYLGLRPPDGLLVSYPKSGSTWLRFMLAQALTGQEADFDSIRDTVPPVGRQRRAPAVLPGGGRLVRAHEPLRPYLGRPAQPIVYLVRHAHAVALSYLDHVRREGRHEGDVAGFVDAFLVGRLDGYGPWADHVSAALDLASSDPARVLLVRYEDLRAGPADELARTLAFLGRPAAPETLRGIVAANTKERMRAKEASSAFLAGQRSDGSPVVRPDRATGWSDVVPPAARQRFDEACAPALARSGYPPGVG